MRIITTHFNPQGYRRPLENYKRFKHALGPLAEHLTTVELSYDAFQEIPGAVHMRGGPENVMWQKERLINYAISRLPGSVDKVCWVDADFVFLNPDWYEQAKAMLDDYPVVQCYSGIHFLDGVGNITQRWPSWTANYYAENTSAHVKHGTPGGAWAARRDALPGGLDESHLTGGGDQIMVQCWTGRWNCYLFRQGNRAMKHHAMRRGVAAYKAVRSRLGLVEGEVLHLYHGDREKRGYDRRTKILAENGFDPHADIRVGDNGLLEWCSDKPRLHKAIADYFASRCEDD